LLAAFVGLASLPFSVGGLILLLVAVVLLVFELTTTFSGVLSVIALAMFLVGSLTLYGSGVAVSPFLIGFMMLCTGGFGLYAFRAVQVARKAPITMGEEALRHAKAEAITRLNPRGQVRLNGEVWTAILEVGSASVEAGQSVEITNVEGTILKVRGLENSQVQEWANPGW
jgi:membrane-bound ClpP family serine protease